MTLPEIVANIRARHEAEKHGDDYDASACDCYERLEAAVLGEPDPEGIGYAAGLRYDKPEEPSLMQWLEMGVYPEGTTESDVRLVMMAVAYSEAMWRETMIVNEALLRVGGSVEIVGLAEQMRERNIQRMINPPVVLP